MADEEKFDGEEGSLTGYELLLKQEGDESRIRAPTTFLQSIPTLSALSIQLITRVAALAITLILIISLIGTNLNAPLPQPVDCHNPAIRQEWRMLSFEIRDSYIEAVQCLSNSPSRLGLNTTRYDDFVYSHLAMFNSTHRVPISLPWHRYYIQRYEDALRSECGYIGYLPYWDWTLDAPSPLSSPIWSPSSGFGSNGISDTNSTTTPHCLTQGPFSHFSPQYPHPHCLQRNFAIVTTNSSSNDENECSAGTDADIPMHGNGFTASVVEDLLSNTHTYEDFRRALEDGPHRWVHRGIGGEMAMPWSTNDPIFFVHHAQIDRLWWKWQERQRRRRRPNATSGNFQSQAGERGQGTSLPPSFNQHTLSLYGLGPDKKVQDVLSTETALLCYKYPIA